jgi:hypothetical protein
MIRHLVLFNLKPDLAPADRDWIFEQIHNLSNLPSVKRLTIGHLLEPKEEWYKPRMAADYDWAITMEFDDEAGLYEYQTNPYHVTVAQEIRKRVTVIKVSDFVTL